MEQLSLVDKATRHIQELFNEHDEILMFHSFSYIMDTVAVAKNLAEHYQLDEQEQQELILAALFYFAGFKSRARNQLKKSLELAETFLENQSFPRDRIQQVLDLMRERPTITSSVKSHILRDAHTSYKGKKSFFKKIELLRLERETYLGKEYTDYDWEQLIYSHLFNCIYFTAEARKSFQSRKLKNITKQRARVDKARKETIREKTGKEFGRAIDTLYRANYNNHISLSSIADGKANMMISINTIILSVIVTLSGAGFTFSGTFFVDHIRYTIPIFVLLMGCLASVIFAIISARPTVTKHRLDMRKVADNKSSLLFFGNFSQISVNTFVDHLSKLKRSEQDLYDSMSVDMYYLGLVLEKKYKLLTWSYTILMIALTLSVVSFSGIFFYTNL